MSQLDSIIKQSLERASPHSTSVYGKNPMTGQELVDFTNSHVLALAATVKPDQRPHLSQADVNIVGDKIYIGIDEGTARHKNLLQTPTCRS